MNMPPFKYDSSKELPIHAMYRYAAYTLRQTIEQMNTKPGFDTREIICEAMEHLAKELEAEIELSKLKTEMHIA